MTDIRPSESRNATHEPDPAAPAGLSVRGLNKSFSQKGKKDVIALRNVDLELEPGEFLVLLGPSGCGKTTLLRCLAGLETPDTGTITIGEQTLYSAAAGTSLAPERRGLGMVFQSYALWPHMSVSENVAYPLRARGVPRDQVHQLVGETLDLLQISALRDRYPSAMSGGQQQRVSLARALVANNGLILFDEPLSNIDAKVRETLRIELVRMQRRIGFSAVYVTHDQVEAMQMADRLAVMHQGAVQQVDDAEGIYRRPATPFVADFVGTSNQVKGIVAGASGALVAVETALGPIRLEDKGCTHTPGEEVVLMIRPESIRMGPYVEEAPLAKAENRWEGVLEAELFCGAYSEFVVDVSGVELRVWSVQHAPREEGDQVVLEVSASDVQIYPASSHAMTEDE